MYGLYTDNSILAGPNKAEVDKVIKQIKKAKLDITEESDIKDFLGVNIKMKKDSATFNRKDTPSNVCGRRHIETQGYASSIIPDPSLPFGFITV